MFYNCDLKSCISDHTIINYQIQNQLNSDKLNCDDTCFSNEDHKLYIQERRCINNCYELGLYDYKKICYDACPDEARYYDENNICYSYVPDGYYLDITVLHHCDIKCKNCTLENTNVNKCLSCNYLQNYYPKLNDISNNGFINCYNTPPSGYFLDLTENIYKPLTVEHILNINESTNEISINFEVIADQIENLGSNDNIIFYSLISDTIINIYHSGADEEEFQNRNSNLSFINFSKCEEELKHSYNLEDENLLIISIESPNQDENKVTNEFNYIIYLGNGTKLTNLSACDNTSITISSKIQDLVSSKLDIAETFFTKGYDIYNLSSDLYTDKCIPADLDGNDITLKDRQEELYPKNVTFCSDGCELNKVTIESQRVSCSCSVDFNVISQEEKKSEEKEDASEDFSSYILGQLNYKIFECYRILRTTEKVDIIKNLGFFLGSIVLLTNTIGVFVFINFYLHIIRIKIYQSRPNISNLKVKAKEHTKSHTFHNPNKKEDNIYSTRKKRKSLKDSNDAIIQTSYTMNDGQTEGHKGHSKTKKKEFTNLKDLTFKEAKSLDKRNFFNLFLFFIKYKIEILSILFYPEELTHRSLTLPVYLLEFLMSFFMNAFLYTDDIISEKYYNNGQLNFFTSLFLSLTSNIIENLLMFYVKKLVDYKEYLIFLIKDINKEYSYIMTFKKMYKALLIKLWAYFFVSIFLIGFMSLYIILFCLIYKKSQNSLLMNYLMSIIESLAYSIGISLIICTLRKVGLKYKMVQIYRTSIFIDNKL